MKKLFYRIIATVGVKFLRWAYSWGYGKPEERAEMEEVFKAYEAKTGR